MQPAAPASSSSLVHLLWAENPERRRERRRRSMALHASLRAPRDWAWYPRVPAWSAFLRAGPAKKQVRRHRHAHTIRRQKLKEGQLRQRLSATLVFDPRVQAERE